MPTSLVALRDVTKSYETPAGPFTALRGVDLDIERGELIAIVGRSGSGKTTLIHLLTGIDRATSGSVRVDGTVLDRMSESELSAWRGRKVGIVFQFFQLLPTLTIAENVILPMELAGLHRGDQLRRALDLLDRVGIRDQAHKLPATLSGGQQQRAAIARALANDLPLIVADEPTGNLDRNTADVWSLFRALEADGKTIVVVSHDVEVARFASRTIAIADGSIVPPAQSAKVASHG